jgi:hypothetical protein
MAEKRTKSYENKVDVSFLDALISSIITFSI